MKNNHTTHPHEKNPESQTNEAIPLIQTSIPARENPRAVYADPRSDVVFRRIFGDDRCPELLLSLLNAFLDLPDTHKIRTIQLRDPWQAPLSRGLKQSTLDVCARDERGTEYIVEMQVAGNLGFTNRMVYYASKSYASQLEPGKSYPDLNSVVLLGICDFVITSPSEQNGTCMAHYRARRDHKYPEDNVFKQLQFHLAELPRFSKDEKELETVRDEWLYFFRYASELKCIPETIRTPEVRRAFELASHASWSREDWLEYDAWFKRTWEQNDLLSESWQKGIKRGLERGRFQERAELTEKVSTNLRERGFSAEEIESILCAAN